MEIETGSWACAMVEGSGVGEVGLGGYSEWTRLTGGTWEAAAGGAKRAWGRTRVLEQGWRRGEAKRSVSWDCEDDVGGGESAGVELEAVPHCCPHCSVWAVLHCLHCPE